MSVPQYANSSDYNVGQTVTKFAIIFLFTRSCLPIVNFMKTWSTTYVWMYFHISRLMWVEFGVQLLHIMPLSTISWQMVQCMVHGTERVYVKFCLIFCFFNGSGGEKILDTDDWKSMLIPNAKVAHIRKLSHNTLFHSAVATELFNLQCKRIVSINARIELHKGK